MRARGVCWVVLLAGCGEAALPERFTPLTAPAHLAWPQEEEFAAHAATWSASPTEVLHGRVHLDPYGPTEGVEALLAVRVDADGTAWTRQLTAHRGVDSPTAQLTCTLVERGEVWHFDCAEDVTLTVDVPGWTPTTVTPPDAAWRAWVYATTLLQSTSALYEPYDEEPQDPAWPSVLTALADDRPGALEALWSLVERSGASDRRVWGRALELVGDRDPALSLALHRRFLPGGCSETGWSDAVTADYASRCYAAGDLECFVNLQATLIEPWRTVDGASEPIGVEALARAGVDVPRFLMGALLDYDATGEDGAPVERTYVEVAAVAEAMGALNDPALERAVADLIEDPTLDDHNRLRATWALAHLLEVRLGLEASAARMAELALPPKARFLLAQR